MKVTELQLYWIGFLLFLALNLLIEATRMSLLNASYMRLIAVRPQADPGVSRALTLLTDLPRLRYSLRLAQAALRALTIGFALAVFVPLEGAGWIAILVGVLLTALGVLGTEFLVDWFVLRDPETWALRLRVVARAVVLLMTPVIVVLLAIFPFNIDPERLTIVTEDELKSLVDAGQREGVLEQDEREMLYSIFRFGDTLAREVMVPRIDVVALPIQTPPLDAVDALLESGYSRVPVFEDTIDNILGLLYAKDLLRAWREGNHVNAIQDLLRPAYFIPEAKKVDDLLTEMQAQRVHMAILVDEYGGMAGLVTLEDIVEEIIGEIQDEYDQGEELLYQKVGEDEYVFHGRIDLDDFNEILSCAFSPEEADTLGGLLYRRIGRVPKGGESLQIDNIQLTIEQVIGRRIRKVRAHKVPLVAEGDEETAHADG
jgi:CBS domain containing-hemolysin-like protein